jgi:conserved domain protein
MKLTTLLTISVIATTLLTGCKQDTYTVDFLKENEDKRIEVLESCKANKQSDENCKNANEAEKQIKDQQSADFFLGK